MKYALLYSYCIAFVMLLALGMSQLCKGDFWGIPYLVAAGISLGNIVLSIITNFK